MPKIKRSGKYFFIFTENEKINAPQALLTHNLPQATITREALITRHLLAQFPTFYENVLYFFIL